MITNRITQLAGIAVVLALPSGPVVGQGMPAEAREAIHGLFDAHDKFERTVTKTKDGYVSKTTSRDRKAVKLLQKHVRQMEARLESGLMVRRWDPAYEEFVEHYDDIQITIEHIDNGIAVTAVGKTEAAKEVARNHAGIVSKFVKRGWKEHDVRHPAVADQAGKATRKAGKGNQGRKARKEGRRAQSRRKQAPEAKGRGGCETSPGGGGG